MPRATICRPHTFHDTWNRMHAVSNHMEMYASSEHVYVNAYNLLAFSLNYIQAFRGTSRNLSRPWGHLDNYQNFVQLQTDI